MARRIPNEGRIPDSVRRRLEPLAAQHGVTVERLVEVVRARRIFRRAEFDRRRSRRRVLEKNRKARRFAILQGKARYAAEGEFSMLLRMAGMSEADFARLAGTDPSAVRRWCGVPLFGWPGQLVRNFLWARNMAEALSDRGIDPEQFKPKIPERPMPTGRYPRTTEQVQKILEGLPSGTTSA